MDLTEAESYSYLTELCNYIESFLFRSRPLDNFDQSKEGLLEQFESRWAGDLQKEWVQASDGTSQDALFCHACAFCFLRT